MSFVCKSTELVRCNTCKRLLHRHKAKKRTKSNRIRYRGSTGGFWNGLKCPLCSSTKNKKENRGSKKAGDRNRSKVIRSCLRCKDKLEYNWYWHFDCMPNIDHEIAQYGCLNDAWDTERK